MCGRYAATSRPEDLVEEFDIEQVTDGRALPQPAQHAAGPAARRAGLQRRADQAGAGGPHPRAAVHRPVVRRGRTSRAPAAPAHLGAGAELGQGRQGRAADDQRPGRVGAGEVGVRQGRGLPPARWCRPPAGTSGRSARPPPTPRASRASSRSSSTTPTGRRWRWPPCTSSGATAASRTSDDPRAWLTTYTIITTEAEPGLDRIHDRQPLVLEREDWADWLDPQPDRPGRRPRPPGVQPSRPLRRLPDQQRGQLLAQQRPAPARARGAGRPRRRRRPHDR